MKKSGLLFLFVFLFFVQLSANGIWIYDSSDDWQRCTATRCNTLSDSVKIVKIFSDEFSSTTLNSGWKWVSGGSDGIVRGTYSLSANPGYLRLTVNPPSGTPQPYTEWWNTTDTALKIMQQVDFNEDFEVETFVHHASYIASNENHGLYIRANSLNAICITMRGDAIISWKNSNGISSSTSANLTSEERQIIRSSKGIYLKTGKVGDTISTYYKCTTTTAWKKLQEYNEVNYTYSIVGLYYKNINNKNIYADFGYFRYSGRVTFTAGSIISDPIDFKSIPSGTGTISWVQNLPNQNTNIDVFTQTSDDGVTWGQPWVQYSSTQASGTDILSVNKRFLRFKADLHADENYISPELISVRIEYPNMPPIPPAITSPQCVNDGWINSGDISFTWSGADSNGVTIAGYYYSIDSAVTTTSTPVADAYLSLTNNAEGAHVFRVMAQADWENNSLCSEASVFNYGIDLQPPSLPSVIETSHPAYIATNSNNFTIKISSTDNLSGIAGYSYTLTHGGSAPDNVTDNATGEISVSGLENGEWIFNAKAIDAAGNTGSVLSYIIKVDYTGKVLDESQAKIYPTISGTEVTIEYLLSEPAKKVRVEIKDGVGKTVRSYNTGNAYGKNTYKENVSALPNGVYFVKIYATRQDGREDVVIKKFIVVK